MRIVTTLAAVGVIAAATSGSAPARGRYFVPEPGDTSLRSKCRSEASMMGGGGGRGAATRGMEVQEMRRAYFRRCMHGG